MLDIDPKVRSGDRQIRLKFRFKGDVAEESIKQLVEKSPAFDTQKNPVEIKIDLVNEPSGPRDCAALGLDCPPERGLAALKRGHSGSPTGVAWPQSDERGVSQKMASPLANSLVSMLGVL